ncbi:MAG: DUF4142 domain-containing protein [Acidobacteriaceae bacterium]|nr:DUF4142 domain-containing protein [Acidobacteriaceae bacterium]MBV9501542.1 DUF4142 domain-containing protein [Acidobacteriaceae bacterium]
MKNLLLGVCCPALCSLAICCLPAVAQTAADAGSDQHFVDMAAQTDMLEAHLGQMAQDQGGSQAVKDFAQMLATDHTTDYTQLSQVATQAGLTVPKGLGPEQDKMIKPFEKLKGTAFDRKFAATMVAGHRKAITEYKKASADAQNAAIKQYATNALPVLEKHLQAAEGLEKGK